MRARSVLALTALACALVNCAVYSDKLLGQAGAGEPSAGGAGTAQGGNSGSTDGSAGSSVAGGGDVGIGAAGDDALGSGGDAGNPSGGTGALGGVSNGGAGAAGVSATAGGTSGSDGKGGSSGKGGKGGADGTAGSAGTSGTSNTAGASDSGGAGGSAGGAGASGSAGSGGGTVLPMCADHALTAKSTWTASASSFHTGEPASLLIDNTTARWTTGAAQAGTEWIQIDFGAVVTLRMINLQQGLGSDSNDYPRSYAVIVSNSAKDLAGTVRATGVGTNTASTTITLPAVFSGRYLLIKQLSTSLSWWSVEEVEVSCFDN